MPHHLITFILTKLEYITANVLSLLYVWQMGILNIAETEITVVQLVEASTALLVGVSIAFWNVARAIQAIKNKEK
jgi:hypothetical protein